MGRLSLVWIPAIAAVSLACTEPDDGFAYAEVTTTTESTGDPPTETEEETDTGDTGPAEPEVYDGLRFIAAGSDPAVLLALDLDDPANVPPAQIIATGTDQAGLFGPTSWGSQVVTHDGMIDQLQLSGFGEFTLSPLAILPGNWLYSAWFNAVGTNAVMSVSPDPISAPNELFWLRYEDDTLAGTLNITPPLEDNGAVMILGRTPDDTTLVVLVDAEMDGTWQIYALPVEPEPMMAELVDQAILPGIPAQNVPAFLWAHVDDVRMVFRKELLPNILRPVAVPIADPKATPVNLAPTLGHVSSMMFNADNSAMLVGSEGASGYRILDLITLDGPTSALPPITMTEPDALALGNVIPPLGPLVQGHGFDAMGRIFYGYTTSGDKTDGVGLITLVNGGIADRAEVASLPPDGRVERMRFDDLTQILAYRVVTAGSSWIAYLDLSQAMPEEIRLDPFYDHDDLVPEDHASFAWSADRSTIVVAGAQGGSEIMHVAELGDPSGATMAIELPPVEDTAGVAVEHTPMVSPDGSQALLFYATPNQRRGLIHTPTDGSSPATAVVNLQYGLQAGAFMP